MQAFPASGCHLKEVGCYQDEKSQAVGVSVFSRLFLTWLRFQVIVFLAFPIYFLLFKKLTGKESKGENNQSLFP